jgi:peptide/nickel transport system substrate-binding protein
LKVNLNLKVGLDPIKLSNGSSGNGFTEFAAIYDTIVRFNSKTQEFEWRTGKFTSSSDYKTWTLAIKPGIKFQDGTDYDAAAVAFEMQRMQGPDATSGSKNMLAAFLDSLAVVDPLTVSFTLKKPWSGFPSLFTKELGMIPSPTQVKAKGANFGINPGPAGAGPFTFVSYRPNEQLVVNRNPTYWGPKPHLEALQFDFVGGGDSALMLEQLQGNSLDLFLTRDTQVIGKAKATKAVAMEEIVIPGNGNILINSFKVPAKVRHALQLAIDPQVINARAFHGLRKPSSQLFDKDVPHSPNVPGLPFQPAEATQLIKEAKAEGWSGTLRITAADSTETTDITEVVGAMLQNVGIKTTSDIKGLGAFVQQVAAQKDFDLAVSFSYELSYSPHETFGQLYKSFNSVSPRFGYSSPEMDSALDHLRVAVSDAELTDAYREISTIWNRDVPSIVFGNVSAAWIASQKVHGLQISTSEALLPGGLWIAP